MILGFIRTSGQRSLSKNRQVEGVGHSLIAGVIGMNMITRIKFRSNLDGALRIAYYGIEVHDSVKGFTRADPLIYRCSDFLSPFGRGGHAFLRHNGRTDHPDPRAVRALDKLAVSCDQLVAGKRIGSGIPAANIDVVDPFQQDHPLHSRAA